MVVIGGGVLLVRDEERVDDLMNFFFSLLGSVLVAAKKFRPTFFLCEPKPKEESTTVLTESTGIYGTRHTPLPPVMRGGRDPQRGKCKFLLHAVARACRKHGSDAWASNCLFSVPTNNSHGFPLLLVITGCHSVGSGAQRFWMFRETGPRNTAWGKKDSSHHSRPWYPA